MKLTPYNPYTRARSYQYYSKACPNCGLEWDYEREYGHQHWRGSAELVEWNRVVYVKCTCGTLIRTRLKPMATSVPEEMVRQYGWIE